MTFPILVNSMTNLQTEAERARRNLVRCRDRLAEIRRLYAGIPLVYVSQRIMAGCALEDATTAFCSALSWAWDAQQRAPHHILSGRESTLMIVDEF